MPDDAPPPPKYPKWVRDIVDAKIRCPKCNRLIETLDIRGIGVQFPENNQVHDRSPVAQITTQCRTCFHQTRLLMHVEKIPLLSAVETLFDYIEADRSFTEAASPFLPSPNIKPPKAEGDNPVEIVPGQTKLAAKAFEERRRRAERRLKEMPTDREVRAFLNKLKKTSTKRSTKSYRQFMWNLGIDIVWPTPPPESPPEAPPPAEEGGEA
ncbi:MAG: hypothetical protein AAF797_08430 [Planctomycetota bacterium]